MPVYGVRADLKAERLVHLRLPGIPKEDALPVFVLWHSERPPRPCVQWLINALRPCSQESAREVQAQQMQQ